jgi:plastocyanin
MHKLLTSLAAAGVLAAVAATAVASGPTVRVADNQFKAKTIRVAKGATVTWKWVGSDSHNVVGKGFHSKLQNHGTYRHRFTKRGTYRYVCTLHDELGMRGTVIVR